MTLGNRYFNAFQTDVKYLFFHLSALSLRNELLILFLTGVEHWVYSDGLASVSVYIEEAHNEEKYGGVSHRGALNAYGTMVAGHYVTVVGEVPRETVEMIGQSVRIK